MEIEKMEFNRFTEKDYDLYILANEDDELVMSLYEPKDDEASSSRLTLLRKLIAAGNIKQHFVPNKEEKGIHRSRAQLRSQKQTLWEISGKKQES